MKQDEFECDVQESPFDSPDESTRDAGYSFTFKPLNDFHTRTCDYVEYVTPETEYDTWLEEYESPQQIVRVHLPEKPVKVGFEMREGVWVLMPDGTLRLFGGAWLFSGAFSIVKGRVRRIIIDDFNHIIAPLFRRFPLLEEVVFANDAMLVCDWAFAGCHRLRAVRYQDGRPFDVECAEKNTFADTPYLAGLRGEEFVSEADRDAVLVRTAWGREFLDGLCQAVWHMEFDKNREYERSREFGCDEALIPCGRTLCEAYLAGDPDMSYLAAQCATWSPRFENGFRDVFTAFGYERPEIPQMFLSAADAGSVRAMLYVAWQSDPARADEVPEGVALPEHFARDARRSAHYLEQAREASAPLRTLEVTDLAFLDDEDSHLAAVQYEADYWEDELLFGMNPEPDKVPNPAWWALRDRRYGLAYLVCSMGSTYRINGGEGYYRDARKSLVFMYEIWSEWCREKGMLV